MKRDDEKKGTAVCLYAKRAVLNDNVEMAKKMPIWYVFFQILKQRNKYLVYIPGSKFATKDELLLANIYIFLNVSIPK